MAPRRPARPGGRRPGGRERAGQARPDALPAAPGDGSAGLFLPGPVATRAGRAFEAVDARR